MRAKRGIHGSLSLDSHAKQLRRQLGAARRGGGGERRAPFARPGLTLTRDRPEGGHFCLAGRLRQQEVK